MKHTKNSSQLKIFILIIFSQSINAMVVDSNLLKLINPTNQSSFIEKIIIDNKLEIIRPIKKISDQIIAMSKNLMPNALTSVCNVFNNPYILLIKGEALALSYLICVHTCEHHTNITESLFSPESIAKFFKNATPSLLEGCMYAAGETAYTNLNGMTQQVAGPAAIALISLNFVCTDCYNSKLPETAKSLITSVANTYTVDLISKPIKDKINITLKNPIVIASIISAGLVSGTLIYNYYELENITRLVPTIISMIEQSVFYTYAYRFSKNCIKSLKLRPGLLLNAKF